MRVRPIALGLILVACLVGAACAAGPTVQETRWVPPLPVGTTNKPVEALPPPSAGVRLTTSGLDIAPTSGAARISLSRALAILDVTGDLPHRASGFGGRLVVASDGDWGAAEQTPTFTDRLSWLVVFIDSPVMPFAPSVQPRLIARFYVPPHSVYDDVMAGFSCTDYRLVDATTGQFFGTWQACERRAPSAGGRGKAILQLRGCCWREGKRSCRRGYWSRSM